MNVLSDGIIRITVPAVDSPAPRFDNLDIFRVPDDWSPVRL